MNSEEKEEITKKLAGKIKTIADSVNYDSYELLQELVDLEIIEGSDVFQYYT